MSSRRGLTDKELEDILNATDSEFDLSDEEHEIVDSTTSKQTTDLPKKHYDLVDDVMGIHEVHLLEDDELDIVLENNEHVDVEFIDQFSRFTTTEKKNIEFRRRQFEANKVDFVPTTTTTDDVSEDISSPMTYFKKFIPDEMFSRMATHTNLYAEQKNLNVRTFRRTNEDEMRKFIGMHLLMSTMKLPQVRMYWSRYLSIQSIASVMSCDRFFQLRSNFHLINNLDITADCKDKFVKIRPLINSILDYCRKVPVEEIVSIDEQIIPFTGRLNVKQYIKGKPNPWGIKVYYLCGKSGFPYDFFLYQGKNTEISSFDCCRFGCGAATVLHLVKRLTNTGHQLYFDNYFSSYQLFEVLKQLKINAAGTIRVNRFNHPPFLTDVQLKKKGRGSSDALVSRDGNISVIKWQDNKAVHIASNFVGKDVENEIRRFDNKIKTYVNIMQPKVVEMYNQGMGGVDLLDQMISYYRIFIKSRKWTLRIIFHFIDVAVCASWILYKQEQMQNKVPTNKIMQLLEFKQYLGRCFTEAHQSRKRGRPSSTQDVLPDTAKKYARGEVRPLTEIQNDRLNHFPANDNKEEAVRCKNTNCKGRSRIMCIKCNVHLCLTKQRNCFLEFHTKARN